MNITSFVEDKVQLYSSTFINTLIMSTTCILTTFISASSQQILTIIGNLQRKIISLIRMLILKWFTKTSVINTVTISVQQYIHTGAINAISGKTSYNIGLMQSIMDYVTKQNIYSSDTGLSTSCLDLSRTAKEVCSSVMYDYKNNRPVECEGFNINFYDFTIDSSTKDMPVLCSSLVISSRRSVPEIREFIKKCYEEYITDLCVKKFQYYYELFPDKHVWYRYVMKNTKTFDDLFFKEKRVIIELVRKFMRKDITKLTLLLHGEPGLGKTSIIKAIANMTGYDIFRVKLQNVQSNIHLLDIFHSRTTIYSPNIESNNRMETCSSLDRIYILEDIDADGDLVHQRSNTVVKKKLDDKIQPEEKPNITLSDVLNCLDGVIENNHIIIMTTNYVEKLDSALIRPGRITYNLKMSRLTNVDVNNFIKRKYGNEANEISVPDYKISPATLESLFHICNTFQDLQQMIERII